MNKKVTVTSFRGVMQNCTCDGCDWNVDVCDGNTPTLCRQHVTLNPTHKVTRTVGSEFLYSLTD